MNILRESELKQVDCNRYENRKPLPEGIVLNFERCKVWNFAEEGREKALLPSVKVNLEEKTLIMNLPVKKTGGWSGVCLDFEDIKNAENVNYLVFEMKASTTLKSANEIELKFGCPNDKHNIIEGYNNTDDYVTVTISLSKYFGEGEKPKGAGRLVFVVNDWHMRESKSDVTIQEITVRNIRLQERLPQVEESLKTLKNNK